MQQACHSRASSDDIFKIVGNYFRNIYFFGGGLIDLQGLTFKLFQNTGWFKFGMYRSHLKWDAFV